MGLRDLFNRDPPATSEAEFHNAAPQNVTARHDSGASWVPARGAIVVDGRTVAGGMLYFGRGLSSVNKRLGQPDPALVDPSLKVDWNNPDHAGESMGYWPSYSTIGPANRAAYLSWLADGRRHPGANIGYVFLFFYGLERRLLVDLANNPESGETAELIDEIRQLIIVYGDDWSFRGYASKLLAFIEATLLVNGELTPPSWPGDRNSWGMPTSVQVGVARYVAAGLPLPPAWALAYLRFHPDANLRTPATRCQAEFDELFTARYLARFGKGLKVRAPTQKLQFTYQTASSGFGNDLGAKFPDLPDVTSVAGPINKLKALASDVTAELDAYSRFLGRQPDGAGTAAAIALLPKELVTTHGGPVVDTIASWIGEQIGSQHHAVVALDELVELWSPGRTDKLTNKDAVSLAALLDKFDVGVEPDVRFGAPAPKPGSDVVLFRVGAGHTTSPTAAYTAAMALVHLTAIVATADGSISDTEREHLTQHTENVLRLDTAERTRLEAHLAYLATVKLTMAGMKRRVDDLPERERTAVGRFLVDVAAADGIVSPGEITTLTKLFTHLGLDEADLYRQIHTLGTGDPGPVTILEGEPSTRWTVPQPVEQPPTGVVLDAAKVQARLAETAQVAALLTNIFTDNNTTWTLPPPSGTAAQLPAPGAPNAASAAPGGPPTIAGLDAAHSAFARHLAAQPLWDRADAEDAAGTFGLTFLDAAIEAINEAAFEMCDEPLIEGDDPVEMNMYAIGEMIS